MLLVRFTVLVLATVVAIVTVGVLNSWWSVVLAVAVMLALLTLAVVDLSRYLGDSGDRTVRDEEDHGAVSPT
jgi:hypothetical protein